MEEKELYDLVSELKLNITAKRHSSGKWDARIYHPWVNNPVLSSTDKETFQECVNEFCSRGHALTNARVGIERVNKLRQEKHAAAMKDYNWWEDIGDSQWETWK